MASVSAGLTAITVFVVATLPYAIDEEFVTKSVNRDTLTRWIDTTGTVQPKVSMRVSSSLSGEVTQLYADFNDNVKKGDLLAVIDPSNYITQVLRAKAGVEIATAELEAHKIAIEKAVKVATHSRRHYRGQHYFKFVRNRDVSAVALQEARARLPQFEGNLKRAEADLALAEAALESTRIRAPIDGVIISRSVDLGESVSSSVKAARLFRIAQDMSTIHVESHVSEANIGEVVVGQKVRFSVDAYPDRRFEGRVAQVRKGAVGQQNVVTYTVMIDAENKDLSLLPGMTALVRIRTAQQKDVLRVPVAALRFRPRDVDEHRLVRNGSAAAKMVFSRLTGSGAGSASASPGAGTESDRAELEKRKKRQGRRAKVWRPDNRGRLVEQRIRIGIRNDLYAEVLGGDLSEGDRVIVRKRRERTN